MKRKLIITEDGSHTFFIENLKENYHSIFGAVEEAKEVFIKSAFLFCKKKEISILEIGFGTGLNAYLTFLKNQELSKKIFYRGIEFYPIPYNEIEKLNYSKIFFQKNDDFFKKIHISEWNKKVELDKNFFIEKMEINLENYKSDKKFDIIYFDAFAPDVQKEMWSSEIFQNLYNILNKNGILTTYSAKGLIKRRLKKIGFKLEFLKHPHKREMIRAIKI